MCDEEAEDEEESGWRQGESGLVALPLSTSHE